MLTAQELRDKYLNFFKKHGHAIISSASLIPENDPSVLFTTAGMHPLVPYLLGQKHAGGKKLANVQKCIRTGDIDEVGDTSHNTFFEMCGNWSLGDYFKKEAISLSYQFLTAKEYLGLDVNKLAFTVFKGDDKVPFDDEAYRAWLDLGISEKRIAKLDRKDNWWELGSLNTPAGPDSEMFYWTGTNPVPEVFNPEDKNWVEIWNDVFMEYKKTEHTYVELEQKNIDTGLGLERVLAVVNGLDDVYRTELLWPLIEIIELASNKSYDNYTREMRIIADHIRASVFIMGDHKGVSPSNTDQGYVLRRLIRRALGLKSRLEIEDNNLLPNLAKKTIEIYKDTYLELSSNQNFILEELKKEEEKFEKTLVVGEKKIEQIKGEIDGATAFNLFQSFGYPVEMTKEIAKEKGIKLSKDFNKEYLVALEKHQELSRTASAGKFKGGLSGDDKETVRLHTAAHLLLAALRQVLGDHVEQKGSNITTERLRFDFSHGEKMTEDQKQEVEQLVNEAIAQDLPVTCREVSLEQARAEKAMGVFASKYGEMVKVYSVGQKENYFSKEICGGPHVERTGELGKFKIKKEESSSAGVRRIKAILE
ncbi:MAG: alanine--tRNA ligase [Candidatus Pacebacteria bacterium]|nr:alanine--tRNA ligase [Candidatus Paceibacterota bacterium]